MENPGNALIRSELIRYATRARRPSLSEDGVVMDLGCGSGWWLAHLAHAGVSSGRLHGLDILPARVDAAQRRVPGAQIQVGDVRTFRLDAQSCSVITLFTVLSSLPSREDGIAVLRTAKGALVPGGVLVVYEPRWPNPLNSRSRWVREPEFEAAGLLPRAGWRLTVAPPVARRLGRRTATLYPRMARTRLVSHRLEVYRSPAA